MASTTILRVRRSDQTGQFVLLNVSQAGSKPLDLKIVGTEHEHLYHVTLKESSIKSLQASTFSGDLEEWKALVKLALLKQRTEDVPADSLQGLETVAAISDDILTITLRKNIGGITQRLGSIKIEQDDEREEVAFPEWVDTAVAALDDLREQLETLQASTSTHREQVAKLTAQFDDLVKAKQESEQELLQKFAALLNSKKLKIRDQQRLLAGLKLDPELMDEDDDDAPRRTAGASRDSKRKAKSAEEAEDVEMAEDDDGDSEPAANENTPTNSDVETDEEGFEAAPIPPRGKAKGKATKAASPVDEDEAPSGRKLPNRKKASQVAETRSQQASKAAPVIAEEDDEDDEDETEDEL